MTGKYTDEQWKALRPRLSQLTMDVHDIGYKFFVQGSKQSELARELNITRQAISQAIARVQRCLDGAPAGWEQVSVWLPPEEAKKTRERAEALRAAHTEG